jgi:hypothetical protein
VIAGNAAVTVAAAAGAAMHVDVSVPAAAACSAARLPVIRKLPVCNGQRRETAKNRD